MADTPVPLRVQAAFWMRGGLKNRAGSLLLYPDRLVHVGSKLLQVGGGGGVLGVLLARGIANGRAAGKAAKGGSNVVSIPLSTISGVTGEKRKLRGGILVVRTITGEEYRFGGVKFDAWSDDLSKAFAGAGRQVDALEESGPTVH